MTGHFLVAIAVVAVRDGKVLLGRRSGNKDVGAGLWEFPSGRLESNESPEQAVAREGGEELGVKVIPLYPIHSYFFMRGDEPCILIAYVAQLEGEPRISDEHSELKWVEIDDLESYITLEDMLEIGRRLRVIAPKYAGLSSSINDV